MDHYIFDWIAGAILVVQGYFLWRKRKLKIITGAEAEESLTEERKVSLSRTLGIYSIVIGSLLIAAPTVIDSWFQEAGTIIFSSFTVFVLASAVGMFIYIKRFLIKSRVSKG